ncbi:hypothetical protein, partial [Neobacillus cucumis]|uniref:hypothetical protein n=1 Tax=Neobacillus cucumis TaxID=1740721 RepID=UPI0035F409B3
VERSIKSTFQLLKMWTFSVPSLKRLWGLPCPVLPQDIEILLRFHPRTKKMREHFRGVERLPL